MTFTTPAIATTPDVILPKVVDRLIAQVSDCNSKTCYISPEDSELPSNTMGDFAVTAWLAEGRFNIELQDGGGENTLLENGTLAVTIHQKMKLTRQGRPDTTLTDSSRGILIRKKQVLAALVGFMPTDGSGNFLLSEYMHAVSVEAPRHSHNDRTVLKLIFSCPFWWDLT